MDHAHVLSLAKRTGLGMSGALNGAIAAAFLGYAGISLFDAVGMSRVGKYAPNSIVIRQILRLPGAPSQVGCGRSS